MALPRASRAARTSICSESYDTAPLPEHWKNEFPGVWPPFQSVLQTLFGMLTLVSMGHRDLGRLWTKAAEGKFADEADRIAQRMTTITLLDGLLLTSAIALLSTEAPFKSLLNYTQRGPYICIGASAGLLLGSIVVGTVTVLVLSSNSKEFTFDVLMRSRWNLVLTMIIMGYPLCSMGLAGVFLGIGLLVAVWGSQEKLVQAGCICAMCIPILMAVFYAKCALTPLPAPPAVLEKYHIRDESDETRV